MLFIDDQISQTHRNNNLQYRMQQSVFIAKNLRLPPYIIKFAPCEADGISVLLPERKFDCSRLGKF